MTHLEFALCKCCHCLVVKLCPTLRDPMDQSMPGPPVFHCLLELGQIHAGSFNDTVQPSRPLSFPSPLAFTLSQHQGLFQGVFSSHVMAKVFNTFYFMVIEHFLLNTVMPRLTGTPFNN